MEYSVIIYASRSSGDMRLTLSSVIRQNLEPRCYEIIIVDERSNNGNKEIFHEFQNNYPSHAIRYIEQENGVLAKTLKRVIGEARGEYIFFTDGACELPDDWIEVLVGGFKKYPLVVGVIGGSKPALEKKGRRYFQRFEDYLRKRDNNLQNFEIIDF